MSFYKKYTKKMKYVDGKPSEPVEYAKGDYIGIFDYDSLEDCETNSLNYEWRICKGQFICERILNSNYYNQYYKEQKYYENTNTPVIPEEFRKGELYQGNVLFENEYYCSINSNVSYDDEDTDGLWSGERDVLSDEEASDLFGSDFKIIPRNTILAASNTSNSYHDNSSVDGKRWAVGTCNDLMFAGFVFVGYLSETECLIRIRRRVLNFELSLSNVNLFSTYNDISTLKYVVFENNKYIYLKYTFFTSKHMYYVQKIFAGGTMLWGNKGSGNYTERVYIYCAPDQYGADSWHVLKKENINKLQGITIIYNDGNIINLSISSEDKSYPYPYVGFLDDPLYAFENSFKEIV